MRVLSRRQVLALDCLPQEELEDLLLQKAARIMGQELSESDSVAYLSDLEESGISSSLSPDRLIITALGTLFDVPEELGDVRYVTHRRYAQSAAADREGDRLAQAGFEPGIDFGFRAGVTSVYPHVLCWRVTEDNVGRIAGISDRFLPTLAGTLMAYIPVLEKISRDELRSLLKEAVLDTTPLVTGLRIIKNSRASGAEKLRKYAVNLYLLGSQLGRRGGTITYKRGWGSEIALNRVNIDEPTSYMAYRGLAPMYPTSDVERPTDNMDQGQEYLDQMKNNRKVKKIKRRLGDEPGK